MSISKEGLKGNTEMIILKVLESKSYYGYDLIQEIKSQSDGIFDFKEGTLYPILYRMEEKGLLTSEKKEAPSGKTRRYYFISKKGEAFLVEKTNEIKELYLGLQKMHITE